MLKLDSLADIYDNSLQRQLIGPWTPPPFFDTYDPIPSTLIPLYDTPFYNQGVPAIFDFNSRTLCDLPRIPPTDTHHRFFTPNRTNPLHTWSQHFAELQKEELEETKIIHCPDEPHSHNGVSCASRRIETSPVPINYTQKPYTFRNGVLVSRKEAQRVDSLIKRRIQSRSTFIGIILPPRSRRITSFHPQTSNTSTKPKRSSISTSTRSIYKSGILSTRRLCNKPNCSRHRRLRPLPKHVSSSTHSRHSHF